MSEPSESVPKLPLPWFKDPLVLLESNSDGSYLPDKQQRPVDYENSMARVATFLSLAAAIYKREFWPLLVGGGFLGYRLMTLEDRYNVPKPPPAPTPPPPSNAPPTEAMQATYFPHNMHSKFITRGPSANPTSTQVVPDVQITPGTEPRIMPEPVSNFQDALSSRSVDLGYSFGNMGGEIDIIFPKPNKRQRVMETGWGDYGWRRNPIEAIDWQREQTRAPEDQREIQATAYKEF